MIIYSDIILGENEEKIPFVFELTQNILAFASMPTSLGLAGVGL